MSLALVQWTESVAILLNNITSIGHDDFQQREAAKFTPTLRYRVILSGLIHANK